MSAIVAAAVAATERALDWQSLVKNMTDVQKLVHLAYRWTADEQRVWRDKLFKENRYRYELAIQEEVKVLGCADPGRVQLGQGPELKAVARHAEDSAGSIINTYNYDLARAIAQVAADTPTANRYTYAYRLESWIQARSATKDTQIGLTETSWSINQAKRDFYRRNDHLLNKAEVAPYDTKCPVCAGYVAGNPYKSVEELYRKCTLPAHPKCPHAARVITGQPLTAKECRELWKG